MSYYREQIPKLIEKYKKAVEQCLTILDEEIDKGLSDDKLHSALKGKKMAAEDAKFYAKEVDLLIGELTGEEVQNNTAPKNPAEARAKK